MNDEDAEIDTEDEPEFNTVLEAEEETPAPRKDVGRGFVMVGFVAASLLGAGLGIAGTKILAGPDKTAALRIELEQSLEALQQSSKTQTKKLGTANSVQKKTKTRLDDLQTENETLADQVEILEQQILDLQTTVGDGSPDKEITDRIAVLEALSSEGEDIFTGANSIATRLDALEKSIAEVRLLPVVDTPGDASALPSQDEVAETEVENPTDAKPISATPPADMQQADTEQQNALDILIDTFPRAKMLAAVKAQEASSTSKPGWLKRALSKHIKVSDDETVDPYAAIDAAEAALKGGNITSALEHIAKLNPPVRTSAAEWVQAALKAAKKTASQQ